MYYDYPDDGSTRPSKFLVSSMPQCKGSGREIATLKPGILIRKAPKWPRQVITRPIASLSAALVALNLSA